MLRGPYLYAPPGSLLNPVTKRFLADPRVRGVSTATRQGYAERCAVLQRRHPDHRVEEFTAEELQQFLLHDDAGRRRTAGEPGWREMTANSYMSAFKFAFAWSLKQALITENPAAGLERFDRRHYRDHVWLKGDEPDALTDLSGIEDPVEIRNRVIQQFLLGTGLRVSEAAAVRWADIETQAGGSVLIHVRHGKGDKYRAVPPTRRTLEYLERWRVLLVSAQEGSWHPGRPLFPAYFIPAARAADTPSVIWHWDRGIGECALRRIVAEGGARIGRPRLRPHDLRRTYAGLCEDHGVPIRTISKNLGHSSMATTETYLGDNPTKRAADVAALDF